MIIFDQLRISDNGKRMYIDVHVNKADVFENVYIDSITIMTANEIDKASFCIPAEKKYIYKYTAEGNVKELSLVIDRGVLDAAFIADPENVKEFNSLNLSQDLFFVYVHTKGVPDKCVPCPLSKEYTLGVTFDETLLYQMVMDYTRELADDCNPPQGFIDFILLWNAFKAAIETEHFVPAINFYNQLFSVKGAGGKFTKGCGCHGRSSL